jgi:thioredoxin-like negative regulator of GroEL
MRQGDPERAFALFRETGACASRASELGGSSSLADPDAFRFYMRAGFFLRSALTVNDSRGRRAFLGRAFHDPSETEERSILRGEAALAAVEELCLGGSAEEARGILEAFDDFSGADAAAFHRARATALVAGCFLDAGRLDEARAVMEGLPPLIRASSLDPSSSSPLDPKAGSRGYRVPEAPGGRARKPFAALFEVSFRLMAELGEADRGEDASDFCRFMADCAESDGERFAFAEAGFDAVTERCRLYATYKAVSVFRAFDAEGRPAPFRNLVSRMGSCCVRNLCRDLSVSLALETSKLLPPHDRPGDPAYCERLQADLDVYCTLIRVRRRDEAWRLYLDRADCKGTESAAARWLKAAGLLVDSYASDWKLSKARKIFDRVRAGAPRGVKATMEIYSMAQDLISGYCDKGALEAARDLYAALPDCGSSARLEEEKSEIFFYLVLAHVRKRDPDGAIAFFKGLPDESAGGSGSSVKVRAAAWLIAHFSGLGRVEEAESVYAELSRLKAEGIEVVRAKSALRMVSDFTGSGDTDRALELLLTVPQFCDPERVEDQLEDEVMALLEALIAKNDAEKTGELKAFKTRYLQVTPRG